MFRTSGLIAVGFVALAVVLAVDARTVHHVLARVLPAAFAKLTATQLSDVAVKKATCPFVGESQSLCTHEQAVVHIVVCVACRVCGQ